MTAWFIVGRSRSPTARSVWCDAQSKHSPGQPKKKYPHSVFLPQGRSNRNQTRSNWGVQTSKFGDGKIGVRVHHGCGQVEEGKEHIQDLCRCSRWNGIVWDGPQTLHGEWFVDEDGNHMSHPATLFLSVLRDENLDRFGSWGWSLDSLGRSCRGLWCLLLVHVSRWIY